MNTILAKRIGDLRKEKGMTQAQLAESCGVLQSCISKWERGATEPSSENLIVLTQLFEVSADYLLGIIDY